MISNFYTNKLIQAQANEPNYIDRIKIELSYKSLCSLILVVLVGLGMIFHQNYSLYYYVLSVLLLGIAILGLYTIVHQKNWRWIIHSLIILMLVLQYVEILTPRTITDFLLMQYCFVTITISFVLLSNKYGFLYSILSSMAIAVLLLQRFRGNQSAHIVNNVSTLVMCLTIIGYIIFICYNFMEAMRSLINQAKENKDKEYNLNHKLIEITNEAEVSVRKHSEFLSNMSHELRTPLNSVIGFTNLLLEETDEVEQTENLEYLLTTGESLLALINDVLDYSKIESGKLHLEHISFDLISVAKKVFNAQMTHLQNKKIRYQLELDAQIKEKCFVIGDQIRLYQILYNLLDNAVKFTYKGEVKLKISVKEKNTNQIHLLFEVIDTGTGIDVDSFDQIFDPFQQPKGNRADHQSIGLGTLIVRRLLLEHQSKLTCESELGVGTKFSFPIVYQLDTENMDLQMKWIQEAEKHFSKLKLLLVEDNQMNIILMNKILSGWNINFDLAENGLEATRKVQNRHYDLIIMDLNMPVMDGFEASRIIKSYDTSTKIVILSASLKSDILAELEHTGVDGFLSKPFSKEDLRMLIYQQCFKK